MRAERAIWPGCRVQLYVTLALMAGFASPGPCHGEGLGIDWSLSADALILSVDGTSSYYYRLLRGDSLESLNAGATVLDVRAGVPLVSWREDVGPSIPTRFYRVEAISKAAPLDSDQDGMDDVFELENTGLLSALDPSDASRRRSESENWLQFYRRTKGVDPVVQFIGREATMFNLGQPVFQIDTRSREVSVYGSAPGSMPPASMLNQVVAVEVSLFNMGKGVAGLESISRDVSVFNAGPALAVPAWSSREISVYNGSQPPTSEILIVSSMENSLFNIGSRFPQIESVSREATIYNGE